METFFKCPTKCFLRSRGEAGTGNAYAAWVRTKNDGFRIEGTQRLVAEVVPDKCAIRTHAMGTLKPSQWHLGIDFAVHSQNLQCSCHAVEQIPSAGRGRTAQFVPIRFVFRNKLNRDDKLLLAFDARVLSEVLRREVGLGKIVYGENYATLKVKTSALASEVRKLTDKIGALLASPSPPELVLNRHCAECEFQNRCQPKAIEKDHLSLLSGMTDKERTNFNSKGIFTITPLPHLPTTAQATRTKGQEREVPPIPMDLRTLPAGWRSNGQIRTFLVSSLSGGGTPGNKPKRRWRRKNSSLITWRIAQRWN